MKTVLQLYVTVDGSRVWFKDAKTHRNDGPAIIDFRDRWKSWYNNGKRFKDEPW